MLGVNKTALIPIQSFVCDKKHLLRFLFFILRLLSLFKLRICLVPVWRHSSAGVRASSGSPITSPSHPAMWNFWMLCSPTSGRSDRIQDWGFYPVLSSQGFCVCVCVYKLGPPQLQQHFVQVEPQPEQSPAKDLLCGWSNIKVFRSSLQPWKCCFEVSGPSHVLQTFILCTEFFFL